MLLMRSEFRGCAHVDFLGIDLLGDEGIQPHVHANVYRERDAPYIHIYTGIGIVVHILFL